jgi:hypothetical protein
MMTVKKLLLAAALIALPVAALQAMTVAVFLEKADALQSRGVLAMFSSEVGLLKGEVRAAGAALRAERQAAVRAGRRPAYCPPGAGARMNSDELLGHFRAIPPAQRARMEVRDGLRSLLVRKYPCPA